MRLPAGLAQSAAPPPPLGSNPSKLLSNHSTWLCSEGGQVGGEALPPIFSGLNLSYLCTDTLEPREGAMAKHRIYSISVASVYPHYVAKAEKKGRTKVEVDEIIHWLTGHSQKSLDDELSSKTSFEDFFARAPRMNPSRALIMGVICGVRVEDIEDPLMREIRYLDKLVDELAKGKPMEKILRR